MEARHPIGEYRHFVDQTEDIKTIYLFNSFSIIDLSSVGVYLNHEKCNGDLGSVIFHNPLKEDMSNLEVSLDGGQTYLTPFLDNFGNVVVLNLEVGLYEIYIRIIDGDREERFIGNYQIQAKEQLDLDGDGLTACFDSNDKDPCIPNDCDLSSGIGCDLSVNKTTVYEYCHFENIFEPEKSAYPLTLDLADEDGYVSYNWSTGDTSSIVLVNPISNTKYYVTVSDQSACVLTDSIDLIVYFIPDIDIDIKHIGCNGEPSIMTLFSPIGDDLSDVELSIDGGASYYSPTMDNFGNIIELGLAQGNYDLFIRHKDHTHCEKKLKNIDIEPMWVFDEDEDGFDFCIDPDDDDECVPTVCENCETENKTDFEDDANGWTLDSDRVLITEEKSLSGQRAVQLINQSASITSEEFDVDDFMSIKFSLAIYTNSLEFEENIILLQSIDGGDSFTEIDRWSALNDFNNGNWFDLKYNGSIPEDASSIMFRLMLQANSSNDDIFIDNIELEMCEIQYSKSETIVCDLINYDDVDGFRDFWRFGGPDALLSTEYPNSGQFTYHLQNGNGTSSSIISSAFSIPREGELKVSFVFTPVSLERTEFLALEVSLNKGLTYVPYNSWISGIFIDGEQYQESVTIAFQEAEADVRIRFTSYANSQYDHFYLDDIKIEFCSDTQDAQAANQVEIEEGKAKENDGLVVDENGEGNLVQAAESSTANISDVDMGFFPNPSHDEIRFSMSDEYQTDRSISVMLTRTDGSLVKQLNTTLKSLSRLEISALTPGVYFIHVFDENKIYLKEKLVKL